MLANLRETAQSRFTEPQGYGSASLFSLAGSPGGLMLCVAHGSTCKPPLLGCQAENVALPAAFFLVFGGRRAPPQFWLCAPSAPDKRSLESGRGPLGAGGCSGGCCSGCFVWYKLVFHCVLLRHPSKEKPA